MTAAPGQLLFKLATEPDEFEQIRRLNYRTFVEEIPQHGVNGDGVLVDRFDQENTYHICRRGDRVIGMVAVRGTRPFSLDQKLPDLDRWLPDDYSFCEIRLLAVEPEHRNGRVFHGLVSALTRYCLRTGYDAAVISGTLRQRKLYEHLGFIPFGPPVGTEDALFQPMYLTLESLRRASVPFIPRRAVEARSPTLSFLPGPVDVHPDVQAAFTAPPLSHRDAQFLTELRHTKRLLCRLVNAAQVEILLGSGTLANDVVAGQLAMLGGRGVVFTNGEFGERLVDHAGRAGLVFDCEALDWGEAFDAAAIDRALSRHRSAQWCWMVHSETSTGVMNDLDALGARCGANDMRVCADCISAIGTVPLNVRDVWLATGVSGKAIAAFPGMSMVFHQGGLRPSPRLPRYLDLASYALADGVPFTHSSNLLGALCVATERVLLRTTFADVRALAPWLRARLRAIGFRIVAADVAASPAVVTLIPPPRCSAESLGERLLRQGFALNYRSEYLRRRNWIQIALMGECSRGRLETLLEALDDHSALAGSRVLRLHSLRP